MKFEVEYVKPRIGAVINTERAALKDDDVVHRCVRLLEERGVLVFSRIDLSDEEQLAFTDRFGMAWRLRAHCCIVQVCAPQLPPRSKTNASRMQRSYQELLHARVEHTIEQAKWRSE
jgi:hypothetical protein